MPPLPPTYMRIPPLLNLCILFLLLLLSYGAVGYFGHTPGLASLVMAVPALLFLWYVRSLKLLLVALLAALGGTLHEMYFIQAGYWWYYIQSFWQVPAYLPFVWANIGILTVSIYKGIRMLDTRQKLWHQPPTFWPSLGITSGAIVLSLLAIALFAPHPWVLLLAFLGIDILYVWFMRSLPLALVGVVALIAGSAADLVAVPLGIWGYPSTTASWLGVPIYIFIGWDVVGMLLAGVYITLDAWSNRKIFPKKNLSNLLSLPSSH